MSWREERRQRRRLEINGLQSQKVEAEEQRIQALEQAENLRASIDQARQQIEEWEAEKRQILERVQQLETRIEEISIRIEKLQKRRGILWGVCAVALLAVAVSIIVGLPQSEGPSSAVAETTTTPPPASSTVAETTTTPPPASSTTAVETDETVLATWEMDWDSDLTSTVSLVYSGGSMTVVFASPDGSKLAWDVEERPSEQPGERRFNLVPGDVSSEYLVLSQGGTVRYFSWDDRQFDQTRVTFMAADAMTLGLDPEAMACVPVALSPKSLEAIRLYEQLQEFKDDPEFAEVGFAIDGPYNQWLTTIESLDDEAPEVLNELGFFAAEVMMLGLDYVIYDQERIDYLEQLIKAGISEATCDGVG
ncbi:MAG: hypothetical protein OXH26_11345 [bacterium]|nr:hypothetical protein [bacterium]